MFNLSQAWEEVFPLILLLLSFQQIVEWVGDVFFCICVLHSDINYGVSLALPHMTYL